MTSAVHPIFSPIHAIIAITLFGPGGSLGTPPQFFRAFERTLGNLVTFLKFNMKLGEI